MGTWFWTVPIQRTALFNFCVVCLHTTFVFVVVVVVVVVVAFPSWTQWGGHPPIATVHWHVHSLWWGNCVWNLKKKRKKKGNKTVVTCLRKAHQFKPRAPPKVTDCNMPPGPSPPPPPPSAPVTVNRPIEVCSFDAPKTSLLVSVGMLSLIKMFAPTVKTNFLQSRWIPVFSLSLSLSLFSFYS